ncbi:MAG: histidine--tRNA ligase [Clostridia bacterium]|nr:histidine--tRNA ligase [Clostridia bacterium]
MKINPVKGMRDYLPEEMRVRDYVQGKILETYRKSGFERISTPVMEDMENLDKSDGGDNLNLIFKVLKRGEKLEEALAGGDEKQLCDMGLRYDLTVPLSRFYAANRESLPSPFKVIQTDRVFRAERPQKGRMREFVQCDIDILGDDSPNAEVELIDVTARALMNIGFKDFTVNINDRAMLRGMLENMGFPKESLGSVCISFDKLDKIGADGVKAELTEKEMPEEAINKLHAFLEGGDMSIGAVRAMLSDTTAADRLEYIISAAQSLSNGEYAVAYAPSLVRGQGYYTGCVFEITCAAFKGAIAGGGRYDGMVGKFLGQSVPAVGFSIGFERICAILTDEKFRLPAQKKLALLYLEDAPFGEVLKKAASLRGEYEVTVLRQQKKLGKQLGTLESRGYEAVAFFDNDDIKPLGTKQDA